MHNTVIVRKATLKTLFKRGDGLDMRTRQARRLRTIVLGYIDALGRTEHKRAGVDYELRASAVFARTNRATIVRSRRATSG